MQRLKTILLAVLFSVFVICHHVSAQAPAIDFDVLQPEYGAARLFPSLKPVTFLKVTYTSYWRSKGAFKSDEQRLISAPESADPKSTPWIINRVRTTPATPDTPEKTQKKDIVSEIERIDVQSFPGNAYIYFKPDALRKGDKIQVGIHIDRQGTNGLIKVDIYNAAVLPATETTLVDVTVDADPYTLKLDPRTVADQELTDGTTKSVNQLGFDLDIPSVASSGFGNVYFRTNNVLSTSAKDTSAKVDLRLGVERSLLNSWHIPGNMEARLIANQAFSNRSFIISSGIKTLVPWGFAHKFTRRIKDPNLPATGNNVEFTHKGLLWNSFVKAPISPEFNLALQYENRIERDPATNASHAAKNVARVESSLELNPVFLFAKDKPTVNDITLNMKAKGWWFPNEKSLPAAEARKFESAFEAAVNIPFSRFGASDALSSVQTNGETQKSIQISYRAGANEANSFIHSSEWKLGFNILK